MSTLIASVMELSFETFTFLELEIVDTGGESLTIIGSSLMRGAPLHQRAEVVCSKFQC